MKHTLRTKRGLLLWSVLVGAFFGVAFSHYSSVSALNPTTMPFQGKVVNASGTNVTDGNYSFTFKLYSVASGGASIWGETQATVAVASGVFQVNLGSTCSLFTTQTCSTFSNTAIDFNASPTLYLGVTFNGDAAGEMAPRMQLGSVPYAFNADKVGGLGAAQFVQLSVAQQTGSINVSGGITTASTLAVTGAATFNTTLTVQTTSNSATAFQVQNIGNNQVLTVDTSASQVILGKLGAAGLNGKLVFNTTNAGNFATSFTASAAQGANIDYTLPTAIVTNGLLTTSAGGALSWSTSGANLTALNPTNLSTGTGAVTLQSLAGTALNLTGAAASTWSTGANTLTVTSSNFNVSSLGAITAATSTNTINSLIINSGSLTNVGANITAAAGLAIATTTTGNLSLDTGTTGSVNIGTGANAKAITVGNATGATALNLVAGTAGITLQANGATAGVLVKNTVNSTTALQIQNAFGAPIFLVDTTTNNLITNPGFEVDTSSWVGVTGTLTRNVTLGQYYAGFSSNTVNVTTNAGGAQATGFIAAVTPGTYVFSFYAMRGTNTGVLGVTITGGSAPACTLASGVTVTTGFQQYTCSFTSTTTNVTAITVTSTLTGTFYLDAVQLVTSANNFNNYDIGNIQLRGVVTSPVTFQSTSNSTTAFQIQNATGTNLLTIDSLNKNVIVGSATTDANAVLIVLDSYNNATDPTGTNGGMYYNTSLAKFRCFENSAWKNCTNGPAFTYSTVLGATTTTAAKAAANIIYLTPMYISAQITVNLMIVNVSTLLGGAGDIGIYNSAGTLVLNGGSSSLTVAAALKSVAPVQSGAARILEPGQYYVAITWNAATGVIHGATLGIAGQIPRNGTLATGGLVLPASITPSSIVSGAVIPGISISN